MNKNADHSPISLNPHELRENSGIGSILNATSKDHQGIIKRGAEEKFAREEGKLEQKPLKETNETKTPNEQALELGINNPTFR